MQLRYLAFLAAIAPFAAADVSFTSPTAGGTYTGGSSLTVEWEDGDGDTPLSDLTTYQLFLCAGGNDDGTFTQLTAITTSGDFANGNKAVGVIPVGVGASTPKNAYFLKMISVVSTGGTVTNYSPRFTLTGMTGTFSDTVLKGAKSVTGTDGPDDVDDSADTTTAVDDLYTVPYYLQTGATKYAPMQGVPGTTITKKSASRLFPTSSVSIATTFLSAPTVVTTITQSQTHTVSQKENTVAAASQPSDDMAKFLARWKD